MAQVVPNITFIATANSVLLAGYKVLLVDVDPKSGLVNYENLIKSVKNKNVSCFINVHLNGNINDTSFLKYTWYSIPNKVCLVKYT